MCIAMGDDPDREGKGVVLTAYHDGARAALAKFKELTAEPTSAMIDNALPRDPYNVEPLYRLIFKSMTEQKWKDIGI